MYLKSYYFLGFLLFNSLILLLLWKNNNQYLKNGLYLFTNRNKLWEDSNNYSKKEIQNGCRSIFLAFWTCIKIIAVLGISLLLLINWKSLSVYWAIFVSYLGTAMITVITVLALEEVKEVKGRSPNYSAGCPQGRIWHTLFLT